MPSKLRTGLLLVDVLLCPCMAGTGQVSDGSVRGLSTASMSADRAQANQGVGKVPIPIPVSL